MSYRKEGIYLCTKSWQNIHEADRYLLNISHESIINDETLTISDQPIFLTHTSLVDGSEVGELAANERATFGECGFAGQFYEAKQ